jgi:hypothetical protein
VQEFDGEEMVVGSFDFVEFLLFPLFEEVQFGLQILVGCFGEVCGDV